MKFIVFKMGENSSLTSLTNLSDFIYSEKKSLQVTIIIMKQFLISEKAYSSKHVYVNWWSPKLSQLIKPEIGRCSNWNKTTTRISYNTWTQHANTTES